MGSQLFHQVLYAAGPQRYSMESPANFMVVCGGKVYLRIDSSRGRGEGSGHKESILQRGSQRSVSYLHMLSCSLACLSMWNIIICMVVVWLKCMFAYVRGTLQNHIPSCEMGWMLQNLFPRGQYSRVLVRGVREGNPDERASNSNILANSERS